LPSPSKSGKSAGLVKKGLGLEFVDSATGGCGSWVNVLGIDPPNIGSWDKGLEIVVGNWSNEFEEVSSVWRELLLAESGLEIESIEFVKAVDWRKDDSAQLFVSRDKPEEFVLPSIVFVMIGDHILFTVYFLKIL